MLLAGPVSRFARSQPDPTIIRAVENKNYRVTVGDVATATGMDVVGVERGLLALAAAAGGHLQVANDGVMAYVFPRNLRAILLSRVWGGRLRQLWRKGWHWFLYLLRISFGIVLIGLIVAVLLALAVAIVVVSKSGSDGDRASGSSGSWRLFPLDLGMVWLDPGDGRRHQPSGRSRGSRHRREELAEDPEADLNFLEAVFSFLFGDGRPNADLEERRWREIAAVIAGQRGVIVAEQLTPFLDELSGDPEDEQFVLPALVRFNGQPHVSPEGDLVYAFPDLQVTAQDPRAPGPSGAGASSARGGPAPGSSEPVSFLREIPWRFSRASGAQQFTAGVLGVVLLGLSLSLSHVVARHGAALGDGLSLLSGLATAGMVYSSAYLLVPMVRSLWLWKRNQRLEQRNEKRRQRALHLRRRSPVLERKLAHARRYGQRRQVDAAPLAYTSEKDLLSQEVENAAVIDAEWQRRLDRAAQEPG